MVERTYTLEEAAEVLRYLIEDRPFGSVVVAGSSLLVDASALPRIIVCC